MVVGEDRLVLLSHQRNGPFVTCLRLVPREMILLINFDGSLEGYLSINSIGQEQRKPIPRLTEDLRSGRPNRLNRPRFSAPALSGRRPLPTAPFEGKVRKDAAATLVR